MLSYVLDTYISLSKDQVKLMVKLFYDGNLIFFYLFISLVHHLYICEADSYSFYSLLD